MNKTLYIVGVILIAGFGYLGVMEMLAAQTPYVTSVSDVHKAGERPVQFIGAVVKKDTRYSNDTDELLFTLRDEKGNPLKVRYKGVKPANFDGADKAVVRGNYIGHEFIADQVLIKCPSKYKGK